MPSAEDAATLTAYVQGVDAAARDAEATWGIGRLQALVGDELRAKFNRQGAKWRAAMVEAWDAEFLTRDQLDRAASSTAAMQRAWRALSEAATEAGHRPLSPEIWETALKDGRVVAVVKTVAEAGHVIAEGRYRAVYTLDEIGHVIDALPSALTLAKEVWPEAKVIATGDRSWLKDGDEIPFGSSANDGRPFLEGAA